MYQVELSKKALKNLKKIQKKDLVKIATKIDTLATKPRPSGVKKIHGDNNLYRLRSGNYRIIYRIFESVLQILVIDIDDRKDVYK